MNMRGSHREASPQTIRRPETKSFLLTSEFWIAAIAAAAMLFAAYVLDDITNTNGWRFVSWIAIAYIVSRGIAKAGSQRDVRPDPSARTSYQDGDGQMWRDDDRTVEQSGVRR